MSHTQRKFDVLSACSAWLSDLHIRLQVGDWVQVRVYLPLIITYQNNLIPNVWLCASQQQERVNYHVFIRQNSYCSRDIYYQFYYRSVIITSYTEKEPQSLIAVDAQRCSLNCWRWQTKQWTQRTILSLLSHKITYMCIFYNQKCMGFEDLLYWSRVTDCNTTISDFQIWLWVRIRLWNSAGLIQSPEP